MVVRKEGKDETIVLESKQYILHYHNSPFNLRPQLGTYLVNTSG